MTTAVLERPPANEKLSLDDMIVEMYRLKCEKERAEARHEDLKRDVFPLIAAREDRYEVGDLEVTITRPQTWEVDTPALLKKFGKKIHYLLTVSIADFRKAFDSGALGDLETLNKKSTIAQLVSDTPRLKISPKTPVESKSTA